MDTFTAFVLRLIVIDGCIYNKNSTYQVGIAAHLRWSGFNQQKLLFNCLLDCGVATCINCSFWAWIDSFLPKLSLWVSFRFTVVSLYIVWSLQNEHQSGLCGNLLYSQQNNTTNPRSTNVARFTWKCNKT